MDIQEFGKHEQEKIKEAKEVIVTEDYYDLIGLRIGVDELKTAFELVDFEEGNYSDKNITYKNIISNSGGYIAKLELRKPIKRVIVVIDGFGEPEVRAVDIQNSPNKTIIAHSKQEAKDKITNIYSAVEVSIGELLSGIELNGLNMEQVTAVYNELMEEF